MGYVCVCVCEHGGGEGDVGDGERRLMGRECGDGSEGGDVRGPRTEYTRHHM